MAKSTYIIPFKTLLKRADLGDELRDGQVEMPRDKFLALIRHFLVYIPIDEEWYLKTYPDVEHAIESGKTKSAKEHFTMNGYFEGRRPGPIEVDEEFYLSSNVDVAEGIEFGEIESAQAHFDQHGFTEGRLPFKI